MKTQTTNDSNRDTIGKNKTNKKGHKTIRTTLHKEETNTTIKQTNPRTPWKSTIKTTLNYHNNKTKIMTQQHQQLPHLQKKLRSSRKTNPIPTTQQEEIYDSPSLVTNHRNELIQQTPEPKNIATPETLSDNKRNKITPKTKKQLKDEVKTYKAKKFTTQLQQTNFCDIGRLTKAAEQEKNTMIALSMYDGLGFFDPSNEYIMNYKNKDILQKYKEISKDRPTKTNNVIQLYDIIKNIELRG